MRGGFLDIIVRGISIFRNKVGRIQFYGVRLVCVSVWWDDWEGAGVLSVCLRREFVNFLELGG